MGTLNRILGAIGLVTKGEARQSAFNAHRLARVQASGTIRHLQASLESHITTQWQGAPEHLNVYIAAGLMKARGRSRAASVNLDHARRFVRQCHTNILGPNGVMFQAQFGKPGGGLHNSVNEAIEKARARWAKIGVCDVTGKYSWRDIERLCLGHLVVDGEFLLRHVEGAGPHRYQVQVIDPALLDMDLHIDLAGGARIRMGVEMDSDGRILAYHIKRDPAGSPDGYGYGRHSRVPADEIIHGFIPEQSNQIRGIPWMNSALERLYQLGDFERSALAASRNAAKRAGFFKSMDGAPPPGFAETEKDGEGSAAYAPTQEGQFDTIPNGYDFVQFKSDYPHVSHGEFAKVVLRGAASGLGVSYTTFGNDLESVNYSSARVGIFEEREVWKELQAWLVEHLHERVDARWLRMAMVAEPLLYGLNPAKLADYTESLQRQPRRWPAIDPLKEAQADDLRLRNKTTSRTRVLAREGESLDDLVLEIERENELLGALEPSASTAPPAAEDDEDETKPARALRVVAARSVENAL
ncbi:phage portal protein [Roseateles sp. UC29_93]|uniref:phage portal protein n=1 Tax=Roseateles sp. UC29_93 TaxID=3350177 RepID=UPI00366E8CBB